VLTAQGRILTGLRLREEGQVLVLADSQGQEIRVHQDDIEESRLSNQSPMAANFGEQLREADFYHLLAFLLSQQTPATAE
jgi:hypothetical protein